MTKATPRQKESRPTLPDRPWSQDCRRLLDALDSRPEEGLSPDDARRRLKQYGANRIRRKHTTPWWRILLRQLKSAVILILAIAAGVSFAFAKIPEGVAILVVVIVNTVIGFVTELRAVRSMEALQRMSRIDTRVRRDGDVRPLPAEQLVPGDIVPLEAGDIVPADMRVVESARIETDESALTGESIPVSKQREPVAEDTPLAERNSMLFKGTHVIRGSGQGLVVATGMQTELGQIARQVEAADRDEQTPLEARINRLGKSFIRLSSALSAAVIAIGLLRGRDVTLMVESAVALAVAAIPEGLPIVATIALARGMHRMARRNALVNRLAAVETLGCTSVICVDKTGTLTENRMTVSRLALSAGDITVSGRGYALAGEFRGADGPCDPSSDRLLRETLSTAALCVNAELNREEGAVEPVGDPMEIALLIAAGKAGLSRPALLRELPETREIAFNRDAKQMATYHEDGDRYRVAVKGAPEAVLANCTRVLTRDGDEPLSEDARRRWLKHSNAMASDGLRVLALATRAADSDEEKSPYHDLTFLGLAGLHDPPRENMDRILADARAAGIRVVMATGDHTATARSIADTVGLVPDGNPAVLAGCDIADPESLDDDTRQRLAQADILARVTPEHKLTLIDVHQQQGHIVGMTGDGVNDAPALTKADIGIAMGKRGTQVAKDASDMILKDDRLETVLHAVRHGRIIFRNIRQFVLFLLTVSLSMIVVVFAGALLPWTLALLPLQVLFLNAVTHVFPALALGVGEGQGDEMQHPPLPSHEPILRRAHWLFIATYAALLGLVTLAAFAVAKGQLGFENDAAISVSFMVLAITQLLHVFCVRQAGHSPIRNEVSRNPWIWASLILSLVLTLAAVYVAPLATVMQLQPLSANGWLTVGAAGLLFLVIGQLLRPLWP